MRYYLSIIFLVFLLGGCGYKPASTLVKETLGDKVYAKVSISKYEPKNSVVLQDALNEAVLEHFKSSLCSEAEATSKIYIKLADIHFLAIDYDVYGYVTGYKTTVKLISRYVDKYNKEHIIKTDGSYHFRINSNSIVSDSDRFEALKTASLKALSELNYKIIMLGDKK